MHIFTIKYWNCIRSFGILAQKGAWSHNGIVAKRNILICVHRGECQIKIDEKEYIVSEGEYIVVPKNHFFVPHTNSYCEYYYFHFYADWLGKTSSLDDIYNFVLPENISLKKCFLLHEQGHTSQAINICLKKIIELKMSPEIGINNIIQLEFYKILDLLAVKNTSQTKQTPVQKICQYLIDNSNKPVTLSELSSKFGYSKQHITKLFKKHYGITPMTFVINSRLEHSLDYLTETSMTISEISQMCGFENSNYYIRLFRQRYATTPQKYRKQYYSNI